MKVTGISKPIRHISVLFLDNGAEIKLYSDYLEGLPLSVGDEIDEDRLLEIKQGSDNAHAFSRACYYLADADYSKKAMCEKLVRAKFPRESAEYAAERLVSLGYIDDAKFAARLAERYNESLISHREAIYKMREKGFSREDIETAFAPYDGDETEKIAELIERKYSSKLNDEESIKKLFAFLLRKGFSSSDIRSALKEFEYR